MRNGPAKDVLSKVKMNFRFSSAFFPSRKINDFTGCTMHNVRMVICMRTTFDFRFGASIIEFMRHTHTTHALGNHSGGYRKKIRRKRRKKREKKLKDFSFLLSSVGTFAHEHIMPEVHFNVCESFTRWNQHTKVNNTHRVYKQTWALSTHTNEQINKTKTRTHKSLTLPTTHTNATVFLTVGLCGQIFLVGDKTWVNK